MLVVLMLEMGC